MMWRNDPGVPPRRTGLLLGAAALLPAWLGCAATAPADRLVRLPDDVPADGHAQDAGTPVGAGGALGVGGAPVAPGAVALGGRAPASPGTRWQLMAPLQLPAWLDRELLLMADGPSGLRPWPGVRWAEPLRDALPRLLAADLARLRGADAVWTTPLPAGLRIDRQLRVAVVAWQQDAARLRLQARWTLADPRAAATPAAAAGAGPQVGQADIVLPVRGPGLAAVLATQRLALWRLAQRISAMA